MRVILAIVALAVLAAPASAKNNERALANCRATIDRAAEYIRVGAMDRARQEAPEVDRCQKVLKAEQLRAARRIIDQYEAAKKDAR
jgi:hypothetical protein